MSDSATDAAKPRWSKGLKWGVVSVAGLILCVVGGFFLYHWIAGLLYVPKTRTVQAARPELGVVKLDPGTSEDGIPGWVARFHLDVSPDHAWRSLGKCSELAKALKGVASCTLIEKGDGWELNKMVLTHPEGAYMNTKTWYDKKRWRSHWKMVDGSFQAAAGYVELKRLRGHPGWCQVAYGYFLKISPMLPKNFERPRVQRAVRRMAHEIQQYFTRNPDQLKKIHERAPKASRQPG
jgi:hypothetical protein